MLLNGGAQLLWLVGHLRDSPHGRGPARTYYQLVHAEVCEFVLRTEKAHKCDTSLHKQDKKYCFTVCKKSYFIICAVV